MLVISNDIVNQTGGGARAGSGGVVAGAATVSNSTITQTVDTKIDSGTILSLNDDPDVARQAQDRSLQHGKHRQFRQHDRRRLVRRRRRRSNLTRLRPSPSRSTRPSCSAPATSISARRRRWRRATMPTPTFTASSPAPARARTRTLSATQAVNVSGNSTIEAWGPSISTPGRPATAAFSATSGRRATTIVYNYALVPVTGVSSGYGECERRCDADAGGGSQVSRRNQHFARRDQGLCPAPRQRARTTIRICRRSLPRTTTTTRIPTAAPPLFLNGVIAAGIYKDETITIAYGALSPTLNNGQPLRDGHQPYAISLERVADPNHFNPSSAIITRRSSTRSSTASIPIRRSSSNWRP